VFLTTRRSIPGRQAVSTREGAQQDYNDRFLIANAIQVGKC
jgi:hypothetical protein